MTISSHFLLRLHELLTHLLWAVLKPLQQQVPLVTTYLTKLSSLLAILASTWFSILFNFFEHFSLHLLGFNSSTPFKNITVLLYFNQKWNTRFWPPLLSLKNSYQLSLLVLIFFCWDTFFSLLPEFYNHKIQTKLKQKHIISPSISLHDLVLPFTCTLNRLFSISLHLQILLHYVCIPFVKFKIWCPLACIHTFKT